MCFFFQAEDGIRDLVRSRGLGDVYKRQVQALARTHVTHGHDQAGQLIHGQQGLVQPAHARLSLIHI